MGGMQTRHVNHFVKTLLFPGSAVGLCCAILWYYRRDTSYRARLSQWALHFPRKARYLLKTHSATYRAMSKKTSMKELCDTIPTLQASRDMESIAAGLTAW